MAITLQDLRDTVYDILREEEGSQAYSLSFVDTLINSAQQRICAGVLINPFNGQSVNKGVLSFLNTDKFYSNIQGTYLTATATTGGATLEVTDTTGYPSTGSLYVDGNIISYTGITTTEFTGCTGILFDHEIGTGVYIAFNLPSDYMSPIQVIYNNSYKLPAKKYDDIYEDTNQNKLSYSSKYRSSTNRMMRVNPFYTIKDNQYLLPFNLNNTGDKILFRYEKQPDILVNTGDVCTIDNDIYAKNTIPYIAVGELFYNRGEEDKAGNILNFGLGQVREMYTYYNRSGYEKISGTQYSIGKSKLNI